MVVIRRPDFRRFNRQLANEVRRALEDCNTIVEKAVKRRYTGPTGPANLQARSNRLRGGVRRELKGGPPPRAIVARVFIPSSGGVTNPVYARIHETGGVIRAKRRPYLVFPVGPYITATKRAGPWVRVKRVRIPRRPVWAKAREETKRPREDRVNRAIDRAVKGFR